MEKITKYLSQKIEFDENTWLYLYQLESFPQNKKIQYYVKVIGKQLNHVRLSF